MRAAGNNEQRPLEQQAGPRGDTPPRGPAAFVHTFSNAN